MYTIIIIALITVLVIAEAFASYTHKRASKLAAGRIERAKHASDRNNEA